uniref:BTB domain-containing protein n=2 Tax=Parascaris univalens TaxID=6257 RepID=A0A915BR82_PARUN
KRDGAEQAELWKISFIHSSSLPMQQLRQGGFSSPFSLAYGPRSCEFILEVDVMDSRPALTLTCVGTRRTHVPGDVRLSFAAVSSENGAEVSVRTNLMPLRAVLNVPANDFLYSLMDTIRSESFAVGTVTFKVFLTFLAEKFLAFKECPSSTIKPLTPKDVDIFVKLAHSDTAIIIECSNGQLKACKWLLYVSTKYFHRLIDMSPDITKMRLNFDKSTVRQCLNFIMCNTLSSELNIEKLCALVRLTVLLKPLNEHNMLDHLEYLIEKKLHQVWDSLDLEEVVQLLVFVKPGICDRAQYIARSILVDKFYRQFRCTVLSSRLETQRRNHRTPVPLSK